MAEKVPADRTRAQEMNDAATDDHPPPDRQQPESEETIRGKHIEAENNIGTRNESDIDQSEINNVANRDNRNDFENAEVQNEAEIIRNGPSDSGGGGSVPMTEVRASEGKGPSGSGGPEGTGAKDPAEALEAVLNQLGHFGFYQRYVLVLLCIPNVLAAMYSLNYVFVADQVPFRCVIPECEGAGAQFGNASAAALALQSPDPCRRPAPRRAAAPSCDPAHYLDDTVPCATFVYENMDTIYAEFGLACREWRRTLVGSVRNAALPLALLLTGYLSDGWGRRTALCVFAACAGALGLAKSFSPGYGVYLALEFLEAALGYGFNSAAYVMMMELARPSLRAWFACASGAVYGLGGALLALLAARVRGWRALLRRMHAPALLLPLYWLLLDESARWLHATRRTDAAVAVVRKAAAWNKVVLDEELVAAMSQQAAREGGRPRSQLPAVLRSRALRRRLALCAWCWAAAALVYYGLTINAVSLAGDKYANFALAMTMEVAASLLLALLLERFGRKRSICAAFVLCAFACVAPFFISRGGLSLALYFAGKLAITVAFNALYVFTAELFPTGARATALAAASLAGRLGSVLAPQTPLLGARAQAALYAGAALSAAAAALLAPETRRVPLPARLHDAERL